MTNESVWRYAVFIVIVLFVMYVMAALPSKKETEKEKAIEPSVPYDYHIMYDADGKMIIAPVSYHFTYDSDGHYVMTNSNDLVQETHMKTK